MSDLKGKVAVVTGAASGIGKQIALTLAGSGAAIAIVDLNEDGAKAVAKEIYMGSVHSHEGSPLKSAYVAAKHALLGLNKVLAKEGAAHNVRSHVVCPGFVRTPLVEKQIPEQAKELGITEDEVVKKVMLGDTVDGVFTTVEDVAETVRFLATFPSAALTGQSFVVSHGWFMQ